MNVYSLDIETVHRPNELVRFLEDNEVQKGDTLRVITEDDRNALMTTGIIVIVILALMFFWSTNDKSTKRRRKEEEDGESILENLFKGKSIEEIEKEVEIEYGVKIEVRQREDEEHMAWKNLSAKNFLKGYSEPDYDLSDVKEHNPLYQNKWKGK